MPALGCGHFSSGEQEIPLARVYDNYLYLKDIDGLIPAGTNSEDSIVMLNNFVKGWVEQQLIVHRALQNLTEQELDFSKQLESYRNSLIIFTYETKIVEQYLDTNVTNDDIESYYNTHTNDFILKEDIIKFFFIKINSTLEEANLFREMIRSENPESVDQLENLCKNKAEEYWLEDEWLDFDEILMRIPFEIEDPQTFLKRNKYIQFKDEGFLYLANIREFKLKDALSPLEVEKENIKKIIINNRKLDLISRMRKDLMTAAKQNDEIEIYH